jgi:hypothetical protein
MPQRGTPALAEDFLNYAGGAVYWTSAIVVQLREGTFFA